MLCPPINAVPLLWHRLDLTFPGTLSQLVSLTLTANLEKQDLKYNFFNMLTQQKASFYRFYLLKFGYGVKPLSWLAPVSTVKLTCCPWKLDRQLWQICAQWMNSAFTNVLNNSCVCQVLQFHSNLRKGRVNECKLILIACVFMFYQTDYLCVCACVLFSSFVVCFTTFSFLNLLLYSGFFSKQETFFRKGLSPQLYSDQIVIQGVAVDQKVGHLSSRYQSPCVLDRVLDRNHLIQFS